MAKKEYDDDSCKDKDDDLGPEEEAFIDGYEDADDIDKEKEEEVEEE